MYVNQICLYDYDPDVILSRIPISQSPGIILFISANS